MIKKIIRELKFRRTLRNSRKRYRIEFGGKYKDLDNNSICYVDPEDTDEVNYMFHVYLLEPDAKIIVELCDGSEREVKLGRRRKTKE